MAREAEFKITLLYFSLLSPELYLARIARRESEGEHDVAEADVRRSCDRSLVNLSAYAAQSDIWRVFDVSRKIVLVAAEGFANRAANVNTEAAVPLIVVHWVSQLPPCRES